MVKNYIIRNDLYEEEVRLEKGLSQQVCVMLKYNCKPTDIYETHREGGLLVQDNMIYEKAVLNGFDYLIVYVSDDEVALKLAERWIEEEKHKGKKYSLVGVDYTFSIFD